MKRKKRSIVDLMNQSTPENDQVEAAVEKVHLLASLPQLKKQEKTVRVTIDTPESLHKALKKLIIDESVNLKTFFLQAVTEKLDKTGNKVIG